MDTETPAVTFHERGWLAIESFLDAENTDEIERELHQHIERVRLDDIPGHVVYEPGPSRKIRNLFHLHKHSDYFSALAMDSRFVGLARAIFDDDPVLVNVELFAKPAQVGSEVPYHQDNAYFTLSPDHAVTIWLALADATTENGCVRYVDRSHKFGNLAHRPSGVKGNSMRLCEVPPNAGDEVCGNIRRGGVLMHHCNTIHRSEPNRSEADRPGLLFVYKAARCRSDPVLAKTYQNAASLV